MFKFKKTIIVAVCTILLTSCYTSQVYHGNVTDTTPQVEVASKTNPILLWGLVPLKGANQLAKDGIGDRKNYTTKTQWTFVNGLLNVITFGLYSPTTTKYYVPIDEIR